MSYRTLWTSSLSCSALALLLFAVPLLAEEGVESKRLKDAASETAAAKAAESLKAADLGDIKRIAVYRLDGDEDGFISTALTISLIKVCKNEPEIMAREELDKLLKDYKEVLKSEDLFDTATRKELGKFLNVDAIVFGNVREAVVEGRKATIRLVLQLGDVELGRLPWGEIITVVEDQTPAPPPETPKVNRAPAVSLQATPAYGDANTVFKFIAKVSDPETAPEQLLVQWDWENDGEVDLQWMKGKEVTWSFDKAGKYLVKVEVKDPDGATDHTEYLLTVTEPEKAPPPPGNKPPVAKLRLAEKDGPGDTTTVYTFDASESTDPDGPVGSLKVRWDWNNDGDFDRQWTKGKVAQHQFKEPGEYSVRIEVQDPSGAVDDDDVLVVVKKYVGPVEPANAAPVARLKPLKVDGKGDTNSVYTFDASGSTDAEDPAESLEVKWDWDNDGTFDTGWAKGKTAQHQFREPGEQRVRVQVRDSKGAEGGDDVLIVVKPGPTGPPPPPSWLEKNGATLLKTIIALVVLALILLAISRLFRRHRGRVAAGAGIDQLLAEDERVRNHTAEEINKAKGLVQEVQSAAQKKEDQDTVKKTQEVLDVLNSYRDDVQNAPHGDASAYRAGKLEAANLKRLVEFEQSLGRQTDELTRQAERIRSVYSNDEAVEQDLTKLAQNVTDLRNRLKDRDGIMKGAG